MVTSVMIVLLWLPSAMNSSARPKPSAATAASSSGRAPARPCSSRPLGEHHPDDRDGDPDHLQRGRPLAAGQPDHDRHDDAERGDRRHHAHRPGGQRRVEADQPDHPGQPGGDRPRQVAGRVVERPDGQRDDQDREQPGRLDRPTTTAASRRRDTMPPRKSALPQSTLDSRARRTATAGGAGPPLRARRRDGPRRRPSDVPTGVGCREEVEPAPRPSSGRWPRCARSPRGPRWCSRRSPAPQRLAPHAARSRPTSSTRPTPRPSSAPAGSCYCTTRPVTRPGRAPSGSSPTCAELDHDMAADPMLPGVGWAWLTEALDGHAAAFTAASGTVTGWRRRASGPSRRAGQRPGGDPRLLDPARRGLRGPPARLVRPAVPTAGLPAAAPGAGHPAGPAGATPVAGAGPPGPGRPARDPLPRPACGPAPVDPPGRFGSRSSRPMCQSSPVPTFRCLRAPPPARPPQPNRTVR